MPPAIIKRQRGGEQAGVINPVYKRTIVENADIIVVRSLGLSRVVEWVAPPSDPTVVAPCVKGEAKECLRRPGIPR